MPNVVAERIVSLTKTVLDRANVEVKRRPAHVRRGRDTHLGALRQLADLGLRPRTTIDVGAAFGTPWLYAAFPDATQLLIEPLREFEPALEKVRAELDHAHLVMAAAGSQDGEITLHVHPDLVGSSLLLEREDGDVNGIPRLVRQVRLDSLVTGLGVEGPYLIKIDTQGTELAVLAGAEGSVLAATEAVVLEVSLFRFFEGGPQLRDVVETMAGYGFEVHDVLEPQYRPLDGALSQLDMIFVRADGLYRREHHYATADQRRAQNEALRVGF